MYLFGYSLDNLSLMALTICTGFVVDDAIVVIENISRYREQGMAPFEAAIKGAAGIGFTVVSISISLIAVFIPILLMAGIVGRLFREFAVTLSAAVLVSLVISLTTTPMMAAHLLKPHDQEKHNRWYVASERFFKGMLDRYESSLLWVLDHQPLTLMVALGTLALSIFLFTVVPKGFFPQQDTGRLMGAVQADQDTSFQAMHDRLAAAGRGHRQRSGRRQRDRVHRRQWRNQHRQHVHRAQAPERAQDQRRPGHRAHPQGGRAYPRRQSLSAGGSGFAHRRQNEQRAIPVHAPERRPQRAQPMGAEGAQEIAHRYKFSPTSAAISRTAAWRPTSSSIATPLRGSDSRSRLSTTRSTTRSGSGRCRRCTRR